ncbi:MAG: AAA family ATPase, partial [Kibdelosporangium sp.]
MTEQGADLDRFVGRDEELDRLEPIWRDAANGRGRLATVTGPAGVGKTRLCEEGAERARRAGLSVVWGRCWADGGAPALWPWQPVMSQLCGPRSAELFTAGTERFARFMAVTDQLAAVRGACVVIDDLHAADPGALLLTRFIAKNLHRLRLALVVTRRAAASELTELDREALPVVLHPFDVTETRSYLTAHGLAHLDGTLSATIHRLTGGNPLFLRRLVAVGASNEDGTLPAGLRDAIDQSLRHLDPPTVRLLAVSALLGRSVLLPQTAAILGTTRLAVIDSLRAATEAGLVTRIGPEDYEFSHDLVVQALATKLAPAERLEVHAHAAEVVAEPTSQAHHAIQVAPRSAQDTRRAVTACRVAASAAVRHLAYEQAAALLATAAGLDEPVPAD